jgi:hypothetical protein
VAPERSHIIGTYEAGRGVIGLSERIGVRRNQIRPRKPLKCRAVGSALIGLTGADNRRGGLVVNAMSLGDLDVL